MKAAPVDSRPAVFRPWFKWSDPSNNPTPPPNWIKSTSPATSVGLGAAIVGVLGFLMGSRFVAGLLTIAGLVFAGIGKFMYGDDPSAATATAPPAAATAPQNPVTNPGASTQPDPDEVERAAQVKADQAYLSTLDTIDKLKAAFLNFNKEQSLGLQYAITNKLFNNLSDEVPDEERLQFFIDGSLSDNFDVCSSSIKALGIIDSPQSIERLIEIIGDESKESVLKTIACDSLVILKDRATIDLSTKLQIEVAIAKLQAIQAEEQPPTDVNARVQELKAALSDANEDVRRKADSDERQRVRGHIAFELGNIGPAAKEAVPELIVALSDPEENVRYCAAVALGCIGPDAASAITALRTLSTQFIEPGDILNDAVKEAATKALAQIEGDKAGAEPTPPPTSDSTTLPTEPSPIHLAETPPAEESAAEPPPQIEQEPPTEPPSQPAA